MENGYFKYNGEVYKQCFGVPINWGCQSVNISGIFMNYVLDKVLELTNINPLLIMKYVDDILAIIDRNEIEILNDASNGEKFSTEREKSGKINFLDMTILRDGCRVYTRWYRKERTSL